MAMALLFLSRLQADVRIRKDDAFSAGVKRLENKGLNGGCAQDRTVDPLIKSQLLYQLSYTPTPPENPASAAHIAAAFGDV